MINRRFATATFGLLLSVMVFAEANAMYAPSIGRFMSRDPIGYLDSTSLYQYCRSMPLVRIDPSGMASKLDECFENCSKQWPDPEQRPGEKDKDFAKRKRARNESLRNCNFQCVKTNPPTECDPFKDPKKGRPEKDKKGCWISDDGRKWCPDQPGDEDPHWDIEPPFGKDGDEWETDCCRCETKKGKNGDVYTRCFPKNAGK